MAGRWWGLTRRQTLIAFSAAIAVGIAIAVLMGGGDASDEPSASGPRVEQVRAGTNGARDAVWVFGFHTLRFTPDLHRPEQVDVTAFGSVEGADGQVHMYDAGTGRVGVLDSRRNTLTDLGRIPNGVAEDDTFAPVIADHGAELWLVSRPGELTRFDAATRRADAPLRVVEDADPMRRPAATGAVVARGFVVAVTRDASGFAIARIDPATRSIATSTHVAAIAVGDARRPRHGRHPGVDRRGRLGARRRRDDARRRPDRGHQGSATRFGPGRRGLGRCALGAGRQRRLPLSPRHRHRSPHARVAILPGPPARFRTPASLVSDGPMVWAMVQRRDAPADHAVRLVGYDARRRTRTVGIDLPSALFAGAAAAS